MAKLELWEKLHFNEKYEYYCWVCQKATNQFIRVLIPAFSYEEWDEEDYIYLCKNCWLGE